MAQSPALVGVSERDNPPGSEIGVVEPAEADLVGLKVEKPELQELVEHSVLLALQSESYRGPVPKPEHLRQYEEILPGAARIIVEEFQANGRHSREVEMAGLRSTTSIDTRAQWIAGGLVLVGFGLVYELSMTGHDSVAIAVAVGLLGTVITGFLTGSAHRSKPKDDKTDDGEPH
ncbi:putative membrane protein [Trinickia symbiotica]|uniref:DUF2335 domain-containing protein n=1 Tax=Trinickia symbiotica TaxID=863227 RepID=A0A2N7X2Q0_9BURK|nr:DUF2335 domain-containing protein [Trinickia symbiotica]PMS36016.1 DUF2335 domain-containing protein [Trinickia symbiotica]PPK45675.1 putative membrane protein [Trinickia symbiotica]